MQVFKDIFPICSCFIILYRCDALSSLCRAVSTDLPDPFSLPISIVHRPREVFQATSCIGTELLYIGSSWSSNLCDRVHRNISLMSSFLLLQQGPACLVTYFQLTLIELSPFNRLFFLSKFFKLAISTRISYTVWYFMIGSSISCFIDMNFVLSATTNLFLGLIFLLMIWLIFPKVRSSRFVGYATMETFIIASHPAVAQRRSVISSSPPFSLSSLSFFVLALVAKHRSHISTKSGSSRDNWYPIGDTIVVMCKVSTWQSLIKRYLLTAPPNGQGWHKAILRWFRAQDRSPHAPGSSKNASGHVGIPLKINLTPPKRVKAWGDGSLRL